MGRAIVEKGRDGGWAVAFSPGSRLPGWLADNFFIKGAVGGHSPLRWSIESLLAVSAMPPEIADHLRNDVILTEGMDVTRLLGVK